ncbi:MAG: MBOAT family O-acyltransferase [Hyphomicrobiaceae bacterium]
MMLFHSYTFILAFLPISYALFLLAYKAGGWPMAIRFLGLASLAYYAQFGLAPVGILIASVVANFVLGRMIIDHRQNGSLAGLLLVAGVVGNIALLGYFKYSNFLIDIANMASGGGFSHLSIILPIGISFFTFIQIGYLVEAYSGSVEHQPFSRYLVFATFFPCITAGPLVLQREIFSQMSGREDQAFNAHRLAVGLTLFGMGLFKKVVLADSIAPYADVVFNGAAGGLAVTQVTAWAGALCYTLQLYFDFSGYSDMALALGLIFGLKLPLNFNSPFKATNISDFWRRWHMTMTRFFTNFIYTPLAMNGMRRALQSRSNSLVKYVLTAAVPAIVTFLVAGIWHGDGWSFVVYGLIHGFAIAAYLGWREFKIDMPKPFAWAFTMAVVVTGLVVFRADNLSTATTLLASMWAPAIFASADAAAFVDVELRKAFSLIVLLGSIVLLLPNTQQILHHKWVSSDPMPTDAPREAGLVRWQATPSSALAVSVLCCLALSSLGASSGFLYYQF